MAEWACRMLDAGSSLRKIEPLSAIGSSPMARAKLNRLVADTMLDVVVLKDLLGTRLVRVPVERLSGGKRR